MTMNSRPVFSRHRRLAAATIALALVAGACGSDSEAASTVTEDAQEQAAPATTVAAAEDTTSDATAAPAAEEATGDTAPAAAGAEFVTFVSNASFADTESALNEAIASNGMMTLGDINQAGALSATGLELDGAHSYFVGNPSAGKTFFEATPAIGGVIPVQMHVWADTDGAVYVSYFDPAPRFVAVDPALAEGGQMMSTAASMIAAMATGNADATTATITGADQVSDWIVVDSPMGFDDTLAGLREMVAANGMMVLGELDEAGAMKATGLELEGSYSLFVGNPSAGKLFFEQTPAIGAVIPIRMQVWADDAGTHVGYFDPAPLFTAVDPALAEGGQTMTEALTMMTSALG